MRALGFFGLESDGFFTVLVSVGFITLATDFGSAA
jgi:hypothetical protein